jgi:deoxyribodipyrimidine photo-lyase
MVLQGLELLCSKSMQYLCLKSSCNPHGCWILGVSQGRLFNPINQSEKFDAEGKFIKRYLPQLAGLGPKAIHAPWLAKPLEMTAAGLVLGRDYPPPIVDHARARARTLLRYGVVRKIDQEAAGTAQ